VNNWKVIFATVVIFGAGVITGGLLVNYVEHSYPKPARRPAAKVEARSAVTNQVPHTNDAAKSRLPEVLNKQFLQQLDEALRLTPEQREAIQKIIADGQNQMRKVIQDSRLEIRDVLMLEQRREFDELVKRPLRKPAAGTNEPNLFKTRLEQIISRSQVTNLDGTVPVPPANPLPPPARRPPRYLPPAPAGSNLSPEAQVILIEAQRARWQSNNSPTLAILPPTPLAPTNAP
jgi:uncharacterized membrane protein